MAHYWQHNNKTDYIVINKDGVSWIGEKSIKVKFDIISMLDKANVPITVDNQDSVLLSYLAKTPMWDNVGQCVYANPKQRRMM